VSGPTLVRGHESKQLVRKHRNRENRIIKKRDKNASVKWDDRVERPKTVWTDTGTSEDCTECHWYRRRLHGVTLVQAKTARSDTGTDEDWYGVTLVQAKTARSDTGTSEDWYRVTMVQTKTARSDTGTCEEWHGVTMVRARIDTEWHW